MDFRCQVKRKMGKGFLFGERCKGSNKKPFRVRTQSIYFWLCARTLKMLTILFAKK